MDLPRGQSAFLWGPRKTGKSTLLRELFPGSQYFDLLDSDLYFELLRRPAVLREMVLGAPADQQRRPVVVDEVQKVPALLDEVHLLIERNRRAFVLCGSSARKLRRGHGNLLGGRAWRYTLLPLCSPEVPDLDLHRALRFGLLPSHYQSPEPARSLKGYVQDYLTEEIRAEGLVRNLPAFDRFLDAVGFSSGELVNASNIARDTGVSSKTVKEYFGILVDTLLGGFVEPYKRTRSRQVISAAPKFYLFDTGLGCALAHRSFEELAGADAGKSFEQFVWMELVAFRAYREQDFALRFWRTKTGQEVDFVVTKGRAAPIGIEAKLTERVDRSELKGLETFAEETGASRLHLVCRERFPRQIEIGGGRKISVLPWRAFTEALWQGKIV